MFNSAVRTMVFTVITMGFQHNGTHTLFFNSHIWNQSLDPHNGALCCGALALRYTTDNLRLLCYLPTGRQANLACQPRNQAEAGGM